MALTTDSAPVIEVDPRASLPDRRVSLGVMLGVTLLACLAYAVSLTWDVLPAEGMSIVLFAVAPICATFALVLLGAHARVGHDLALAWAAAGVGAALPAMVAQLVSFPAVSDTGGPLGTGLQENAALYLLFHLFFVAGALAGALRAPAGLLGPAVVVAWLLVVGVATDLVPVPVLLEGTSFSSLLIGLEVTLVALTGAVLLLWLIHVGFIAPAPHGWVAVALSLALYDVLLNALAAERFTAVWWASLSFRAATYAVLSFGLLLAALTRWRDIGSFSRAELDRREAQLGSALEATAGLLSSAEDLSRAVRSAEVGRVMSANACRTAQATAACVLVPGDADAGDLRLLAAEGWEPGTAPETWPADAVRALRPTGAVFLTGRDEMRDHVDEHGGLPFAGASSLALLPVVAGERGIGFLAVWSMTTRAWSPEQRRVLAGLAVQGGQALARARAYEDAAIAARTLQGSLLPSELPSPDRVEVAARYLPAVDSQLVGGDWYDCLVVDEHRVALIVGDVMGKGLRAAAQMGQVRTAVRTLIAVDPSPAAVLNGLDELNLEMDEDEIVTLVYVLLDTAAGTARVARAGHLPPLVVDPEGEAAYVEEGSSTPLGLRVGVREEAAIEVPPGSLLVLYTDGLVEDRATGLTPGLGSLVTCLVESRPDHPGAADLAECILAVGHSHVGQDDVAVLVAHYE